MRSRFYSSAMLMIAVDNAFIALLIGLIGDVSTPFSAFLVFMIIHAAYRYKLRGTLTVVGMQLICISLVVSNPWYSPLELSQTRSGLLIAAVLIGLGVFIERLTHIEREEKDELELMSNEIEAERKHLVTLLDGLNDAIFVVDSYGRVLNYNAAAEELTSASGDIHGKQFSEIFKLYPHVDRGGKAVNLLKKTGAQHRRDLSTKVAGGAVVDLDISIQTVRIEGMKTTDYVIVCKDITKERTLDEQRSEFISVASHELRTPITIMEAALSAALLSRDKLDKQTLTVIEQAHRHCLFLASIVKDLAILAEAGNDNLPIQIERVDPHKLLKQITNDFEAQAKQKGLAFKVVVEPETPIILSTENHIREILQNYITNAIKYSPDGTIIVRAEPSNAGGVIFSVHDNGIGISPSDQKHLFTKFFRSEDYRTRATGGTGLGLYLCMELAQRLNGNIWCESELNKGSIFFLELPPASRLSRDQREVVKAEVANLVEGI